MEIETARARDIIRRVGRPTVLYSDAVIIVWQFTENHDVLDRVQSRRHEVVHGGRKDHEPELGSHCRFRNRGIAYVRKSGKSGWVVVQNDNATEP